MNVSSAKLIKTFPLVYLSSIRVFVASSSIIPTFLLSFLNFPLFPGLLVPSGHHKNPLVRDSFPSSLTVLHNLTLRNKNEANIFY